MQEINLREKEAIAEFFGKETLVEIKEKTKILYIDESGNESAFKVYEGDVVTLEQITGEAPKKKKKKDE